ncbi:hypothetical protein ACRRTK_021920 [Alexandromys fortis]
MCVNLGYSGCVLFLWCRILLCSASVGQQGSVCTLPSSFRGFFGMYAYLGTFIDV